MQDKEFCQNCEEEELNENNKHMDGMCIEYKYGDWDSNRNNDF